MSLWVVIIFALIAGALVTFDSSKPMQILQLSSYRIGGLIGWFKRTKGDYLIRYFALSFFCFISMFVYVMCFRNSGKYAELGFLFFVLISCYFAYSTSREKKKTPLKVTKRIIRLSIADFVLNSALAFILIWFLRDTEIMYSLVGIMPLVGVATLCIAHFIVLPLEKTIGGGVFIKRAVNKLSASSPKIIAITGSYGKTTAKNILARMLAVKYKVFASPGSYNTPMGLSKCINEDYSGEEIFVAEFGARFSGDIEQLMRIFHPMYAILTSIGNQHLETFGSQSAIIKEKTKILNVQFAAANGDSKLVAEYAANAHLCGKKGEVTYMDVKSSLLGTDFVLSAGGKSVDIHTRLVGEYVPSSIATCACMAMELGVSLQEIAEVSGKLPFVEHRLEVLDSGDVKILDDSYNSNPSGANSALDILNTFGGTKVIITPGFVELGPDSEKCLKALGEKIASVCDFAILLGPNAEIIKSGMTGYENVQIVGSLDEAMESLKSIPSPMAVLFENDLPDNY